MTPNRPKPFDVEEINTATNEVVISVGRSFCPAVAAALITIGLETRNIAVSSLGWFIRDSGKVLEGTPIDRFPLLAEKNILTDEVPS